MGKSRKSVGIAHDDARSYKACRMPRNRSRSYTTLLENLASISPIYYATFAQYITRRDHCFAQCENRALRPSLFRFRL